MSSLAKAYPIPLFAPVTTAVGMLEDGLIQTCEKETIEQLGITETVLKTLKYTV
jgi:hypothetical protein